MQMSIKCHKHMTQTNQPMAPNQLYWQICRHLHDTTCFHILNVFFLPYTTNIRQACRHWPDMIADSSFFHHVVTIICLRPALDRPPYNAISYLILIQVTMSVLTRHEPQHSLLFSLVRPITLSLSITLDRPQGIGMTMQIAQPVFIY